MRRLALASVLFLAGSLWALAQGPYSGTYILDPSIIVLSV